MPHVPLRRPPRGMVLLVGGTVLALAVVSLAVASDLIHLGVGGAPKVRIDAPTQ